MYSEPKAQLPVFRKKAQGMRFFLSLSVRVQLSSASDCLSGEVLEPRRREDCDEGPKPIVAAAGVIVAPGPNGPAPNGPGPKGVAKGAVGIWRQRSRWHVELRHRRWSASGRTSSDHLPDRQSPP